ncbi:MAG: hypothetical protein Q4E64_02110 [Phascolarctobacterium sp.]|uniref:hypothetical protein n=1 Tax=Phascolarctobacterium sp. TaxID=2049039 RepID=UPI0026DD1A51|nr:hypothetical protein [Phascolarctobacterium sp.]MDO4920609.1 hypothetical protein [Phascolarctobacterium sp.]
MKNIMLVEVYKTVNYPGGIEKVLCNFANEFTKRGYEVTYICLDTEEGKPYYFLDDKVNFVNLCYIGEKYNSMSYKWAKIKKEIKRFFVGGICVCLERKFQILKQSILRKNLLNA